MRVDERLLIEVSEPRLGCKRVGDNVNAVDEGGPGRGPEQPAQHSERRRLAGAVRAQKSEHLAAHRLEADAINRGDYAVALDQLSRIDGRIGSVEKRHYGQVTGVTRPFIESGEPTTGSTQNGNRVRS